MSPNHTPSDALLSQAISALLEAPVPQGPLAQTLAQTRKALAEAASEVEQGTGLGQQAWRTLMRHKRLSLSAAAGMVIAMAVTAFITVELAHPTVAFSEVLKNMSSMRTARAEITIKGKTGRVWAKRPNKLRIEYEDGTYEISNGPTLWIVDPKANTAVQKPSLYYRKAQRLGKDVLDVVSRLQYEDDFSGFFSQGPVERTRRGGKTYDVYRMQIPRGQTKLRFEALVEARTHLPYSMKLERHTGQKRETLFALTVLAVDQPIPDEKFVFKPPKGMRVTVEEPHAQPPAATTAAKGSTLSGRIVWASSSRPVGGARVAVSGRRLEPAPEGKNWRRFFVRAETGPDGRWKVTGAPADEISISVRSWERNWPAVPTFRNNVGSLMRPAIRADGRSEYTNLNFEVHRPEDVYARITINVTDENGKPLTGVGARLVGLERNYEQLIYAARGKEYSGPEGKFGAADIWPTDQLVRVVLVHKQIPSPYAAWLTVSEPFGINPKGRYHFDMVLPFARQLKLKVVDPAGRPLQGISAHVIVNVRAGRAMRLFPLKPDRIARTDANGVVTIGRLSPSREATVTLKRMRPDAKFYDPPLASACLLLKGPKGTDGGELKVTFDDRPIRIEGTIVSPEVPGGTTLGHVYCVAGGDRWTCHSRVKAGSFVLEGLPPGKVGLGYRFHSIVAGVAYSGHRDCKGTILLQPGYAYTVKIVGDRFQLLGKKPIGRPARPAR